LGHVYLPGSEPFFFGEGSKGPKVLFRARAFFGAIKRGKNFKVWGREGQREITLWGGSSSPRGGEPLKCSLERIPGEGP